MPHDMDLDVLNTIRQIAVLLDKLRQLTNDDELIETLLFEKVESNYFPQKNAFAISHGFFEVQKVQLN